MHSRKKVPKDEATENAKLQKAQKFSDALNSLIKKKDEGCKDRNLLNEIANLLRLNPEFNTLWNYRREILMDVKNELNKMLIEFKKKHNRNEISKEEENELDSITKEFNSLCHNELFLTLNCIKQSPKSYSTWHHRGWIITFMNNPDLQKEIDLCNQFLNLDERNFHCWDYRRFVVNLAKIDPIKELDFSLEKIEQNFSNFSSWYYRSSLIKQLYMNGYDNSKIQKIIEDDYKRVEEAIYTDPTDQSVWFYFRWLCSIYSNKLENFPIRKMNSKSVDIKQFCWITTEANNHLIALELSCLFKNSPNLKLTVNNESINLSNWFSISNGLIWLAHADIPKSSDNLVKEYKFQLRLDDNFNVDLTFSKEEPHEFLQSTFIYNNSHPGEHINIDSKKYQSLKELLELEPDNKWVNYTLAWLESNDDLMNDTINNLIKMDSLRSNYYHDLRSKVTLRKILSTQNLYSSLQLSLSNLNLHSLRYTNQLMHIQYLDLSKNSLIKLGNTFEPLVSLKCLILDFNGIYLFDNNLKLPNLRVLSLRGNKISKKLIVKNICDNFVNLKHLCLVQNPISRQNATDLKDVMQSINKDIIVYLDEDVGQNILNIIDQELNIIKQKHAYVGQRVE